MEDNKKIVFLDDSVDIGKEPLPLDEEAQKVHDELMKKYKVK